MRLGIVAPTLSARLHALFANDPHTRVEWEEDELSRAIVTAHNKPVDIVIVASGCLRPGSSVRSLGTPVVVLRTSAADEARVYAAMNEGATYAMDPLPDGASDAVRDTFIRRIRRAAAVSSSRMGAVLEAPIVALGASTGGPGALCDVLKAIGPGLSAPIVIIQHVEPEFIPGLAAWIAHESGIPCDLSSEQLVLAEGRALVAATSQHLVFDRDDRMVHRPALRTEVHHPSVDALFTSLAASTRKGIAALLTGMGRDGADGLLALKTAGWTTFAQDETSCSVYGMPRAAKELGAVDEVLSPTLIGSRIRRAIGGRS